MISLISCENKQEQRKEQICTTKYLLEGCGFGECELVRLFPWNIEDCQGLSTMIEYLTRVDKSNNKLFKS